MLRRRAMNERLLYRFAGPRELLRNSRDLISGTQDLEALSADSQQPISADDDQSRDTNARFSRQRMRQ